MHCLEIIYSSLNTFKYPSCIDLTQYVPRDTSVHLCHYFRLEWNWFVLRVVSRLTERNGTPSGDIKTALYVTVVIE